MAWRIPAVSFSLKFNSKTDGLEKRGEEEEGLP